MSNLTIPSDGLGPKIIQLSDFYHQDGLLHPIIIGTIALGLLFTYLRYSSNRTLAQMSVFDAIVSVALGSTVAGIVNGTSLVRGLIALFVLFFFQFLTSYLNGHYPLSGPWLASPSLIIAFRGKALEGVMRKHRISKTDLYSALRQAGVWSIEEIEVVAIEATGAYSIYKIADYPKNDSVDIVWDMPGYKALREGANSGDLEHNQSNLADEAS